MGKEKKTSVTDLEFELLRKVGRHLGHPRKLAVIQCVYLNRFATASVIQRKCGIKQPSVSRYLKQLMCDAELVVKVKIGSTFIYELNAPVWNQLTILMGKLSA